MVSRRSTRSHQAGDPVPDLEEDQPALEDDELDEEEDEVEEVTRCICGNPELQLSPNNPDFDDVDPGFFIQCEECQVWQHGYCVGIKDEVDAPDKYWCELCKPELHTLVYKGPKDQRSLYTPVTEKKKKVNRKIKEEKEEVATKKVISKSSTGGSPVSSSSSSTAVQPSTANKNKHSSSPETRHRRERSRPTLNSRDAEYEMMLKKALEESAKESGVQPEEPELSEHTRERSTRRSKLEESLKKEEDDGEEEVEEFGPNHETMNNSNSKDASKQIELDFKNPDVRPENKRRRLDLLDSERKNLVTDASALTTLDNTLVVSEDYAKNGNTPATASTTASTLNEMSENDSSSVSKNPTSNGNKKKRPRRTAASSSNSKNDNLNNNKNSSPKKPRSKGEIDADKPTKPRLPQQRISMYEMRRRTSAILEFLVRTQSELRHEFENGADITEFIDDTTGSSELNKDDIKLGLKKGYTESVFLMESLTSKIIDWNTKYGESE